MHTIVFVSYLAAGVAYFVGATLLALSWRGQRNGALLILAMTVSVLWAGFLAYAEWQRDMAVNGVLLAEMLRYGAWLTFLGSLIGAGQMAGRLRGLRIAAPVLWIVLALYCLLPTIGLLRTGASPFNANLPLVGVLILALLGVVFLEQIYRNIETEQRWALKFLVIALGALFAYDIFLYSYATLYRQFNLSAWAARGFIDALLVPLLLVAAARNPEWSLKVGVSRRAVFYSTSLMVVAFYILATAVGGYYVRQYGGDWGQARSHLRVFLHKNFFSFRHDFREEWLRLTTTLASGDAELPLRALRAMAQTMDSPAGVIFMRADADDFVLEARLNMPAPAGLTLPSNIPALKFMRESRWIYDLSQPPPLGDDQLRLPSALTGLPRAWLVAPLVLEDQLIAFVVLAQPRARRAFDWEDMDLLRAAGSQVASTLAQAADAQRLAEARQFEGFNRLTAFLMHDLKNVAAQQSLLLQNAERHKHNPAFVDDMLLTVANSVQRISLLLEQLRGDAAPGRSGRIQLAQVIDKALSECRVQSPQPAYIPDTEELWIRADTEQLATVLGHVVRNAQDAAQAHGHVTLTIRRAAKDAVIEIEDDGAGMDEDFIRSRLFKPFFTTKASKGMGIGAYQAREYVHSLGGSMSVRSTPGQGTVFAIRLPLSESADDMTASSMLKAP
jgi:signal transduction histidine kinase